MQTGDAARATDCRVGHRGNCVDASERDRRLRAARVLGWSIFHADFIPPPSGQLLEVRVWQSGGETVNVYRAALTAAR